MLIVKAVINLIMNFGFCCLNSSAQSCSLQPHKVLMFFFHGDQH